MGQSKKRRPCPAVGREITAAECGENRHSRYACPESCLFNPFAAPNYTALLEMEDLLDAATMKRIDSETHGGVWRELEAARRKNPGHGLHAATVWRLFFERDAAGHTCAGRWEGAGFPELNNDERVFVRAKMRMRVALLEVHRVLDTETIEAVDLLEAEPKPLCLRDRSVAARAVRFSAILTWVYPLPHFWRLSGTGLTVEEIGKFGPEEIVRECIAHLGGPAGPGEPRARWLAENFVRVDEALTATAFERRRRMFAGMDAQFGTATYELCAPFAKCRAVLAADPAVARDDLSDDERREGFVEAIAWFDEVAPGSPASSVPGRRVRGRIVLAPDRWRVEAMGAARLDELRARFEARLGSRVRFAKERRDNLGLRFAAQEPAVDLALVPPRLLEQPMQLDLSSSRVPAPPPGVSLAEYQARLMQAQRLAVADTSLEALDGRTPREAAGDRLLRPRLIAFMKPHVRQLDEQNLHSGRHDDINGLLRELGLSELDFPPPPSRPIPPDDDDAGDDGATDLAPARALPPAPTLMGAPLSFEQAVERLEIAMAFPTAKAALDELAASGSTVIDDAAAITEDWLNDDEFGILVTFLLQAWFALVPRGVRAPELRYDAMAAAMTSEADPLGSGAPLSIQALERFFDGCRQPGLMQALSAGVVHSAEQMPKKLRPAPPAVVGMVVALKVVIDEIDYALRRA